ncbi:MAG TPA: hypothetical protein VGK75_08055, partial [Casimicrobiaceae bacterium]
MPSSGHDLYHVAHAASSRPLDLHPSNIDDSAPDSNGGAGVVYANRADTHRAPAFLRASFMNGMRDRTLRRLT